jgi:signal transduction histidine kinase
VRGQWRDTRQRWVPPLVATAVGAVLTVVVLSVSGVPLVVRAPALHVAVETANVLVGLLVALLVYGRYRMDRRLHQLFLIDALGVLVLAEAALAVSAALGESAAVDGLRWLAVGGRVAGSALLFASALTPGEVRVSTPRAMGLQAAVAATLATGAALAALGTFPPPVSAVPSGDETQAPVLDAAGAVVAVQAVGTVLLAAAAALFTRRSVRTGDELTRWLAAGTILAAFARVHYLFYPSLLSDVVYTGDALRAGFYACLLVGALREIEGYWRLRATAAVLDERRRIARDLHDGITQELTFILAQSRLLPTGAGGGQAATRIEDASARALDEARRAVTALGRTDRRSFVDELRGTAGDLAGRYEVEVTVQVGRDGTGGMPTAGTTVEPTPDEVEQLLRIVAEAVRNGVRHGRAGSILVTLATDPSTEPERRELTVADDGRGFDPHSPRPRGSGGYGLTSMRDRAAAIGGTLRVESEAGTGTTVTVVW